MSRATVACSLALLGLSGCGGCGEADPAPAAASAVASAAAPPLAPPLPGEVRPWPLRLAHGRPSYALPTGCEPRAPAQVAEVAPSSRFLAAPGALGALVVVDSEGAPPRLTGAAAVDLLAPAATPTPMPWPSPELAPRVARAAGGAWLAAYQASPSEVALYRDGARAVIARGDRIDAVDLGCAKTSSGERCALVTSRATAAWSPGAELWVGEPAAPASTWTRHTIAASAPDGAPVALASIAPPVVALLEGGELYFRGPVAGAAPVARLPAPERLVYAALAQPTPMAIVGLAPVDARGCAPAGAGLTLEVADQPAHALTALSPPLTAQISRLGHGYLVTYLALTDCEAERAVAYGLLLDDRGAPRGAPIPLSDAESYAVTSRGDEVDLWLQSGGEVTWLRARCSSGAPTDEARAPAHAP